MEDVYENWKKEQERIAKEKIENERLEKQREKLKESENTDLSAPNKISKTSSGPDAKNLTSKQKAAIARQERLAKAKNAANKANKKTSEGKSTKGGKSVSKSGNEGTGKEKSRNRSRTKTVKVKTDVDNSDGPAVVSDTVVDVIGVTGTEPDDGTVDTAVIDTGKK